MNTPSRATARHAHFSRWGFALRSTLAMGVALAMAACGGTQEAEKSVDSFNGASSALMAEGSNAPGPASARDEDLLAQGARLNSTELQVAERRAEAAEQVEAKAGTSDTAATPQDIATLPPGTIAPKSAYLSGEIARKAAAVRIPAYRFYNSRTGAHFFTTSETERANVAANLSPPFNFEGAAFSVASDFSPGLSPVHRFYNTRSGVHFYTISEAERANVVATLPYYNYEGVAYHASQVAGAGFIPFYRFYVPSKGFHFYTASETERANIQATLSAIYKFEGVGYYVLSSEWRAEKLPHTGMTTSQCYAQGSNTLVGCNQTLGEIFLGVPSLAQLLNPQQDGHRRNINTLSYSELPKPGGGIFDRTECMNDNVTGLVWEGKTTSGLRSWAHIYTNSGSNAADDTGGYIAAVNATQLCGFNDWRLPTRYELLALVNHGTTSGASIDTTAFPHTINAPYWSADVYSTDSTRAWYVFFDGAGSGDDARSNSFAVRLVRGRALSGPRYTFSTVAYGSDGANNAVNDAWTGLQWRRCEEGRVWSGSACTGTPSIFGHEQALAHAKVQNGWRLPNVKELGSLTDLSVSAADAARIDGAAFPGAVSNGFWWSSSPYPREAGKALVVDFDYGYIGFGSRGAFATVRLVRVFQ